jgi:hypothetical protein
MNKANSQEMLALALRVVLLALENSFPDVKFIKFVVCNSHKIFMNQERNLKCDACNLDRLNIEKIDL